MTPVRFLVDEDVPEALVDALLLQEPTMDILTVGQPGAPPKGTLDPDLLRAAEAMGRALISRDRRTMPDHLADHFAAGRHTWGVFLLRRRAPLARCIQDLLLIWRATTADEWVDRTEYLPW
jgi:Domain of unknown function (DUF5615)